MRFGNGIPLETLRGAAVVSTDQLASSYGPAFLRLRGLETLESRSGSTDATLGDQDNGGIPLQGEWLFPLVRKPGSSFDFISVGRHANNDIHLPHSTVSRFHAFLRLDDEGAVVQDSRSSFGTFVESASVPKVNEGGPVELRSGTRLRFGYVPLTFLSLEAAFALLREVPVAVEV